MKDLFSIHIYTAVIRLRLDHMPGGLFLVWRDWKALELESLSFVEQNERFAFIKGDSKAAGS